jgi:Ca2+-binding RTX toxin-like protein
MSKNSSKGGRTMRNTRIRLTHVLALGVALAIALPVGSSASASQVPKCLEETPTLVGTPGDDFLVGTRDDDVIVGLGGNDVIAGLAGEDLICGGEGNDEVEGGPDLDALSGDAGDDKLDGGEHGTDLAVFINSPAQVQVSLTTGVATGDGTDTLTNIEGLFGSAFDDTLEGNELANVFVGWEGNDRSTGLGGFDNFNADDGDDAFDGGSGEDLVYYDFAPGPVTVNLAAGQSRGHGADALVSIEDVYGSKFADRITGNAGPNWLHGYNGADVVSGGGGADQVFGDRGDDVLLGGAAADRLSGGAGRDRLDGGAGRDRCTGEKKRSCP